MLENVRESATRVTSASPAPARALRAGAVFVFMLVLAQAFAAISAAQAGADSRIRAGSCDVYDTAILDPIALTEHLHNFYMGTVLSNDDTGFDVKARAETSCSSPNSSWSTAGGWSPDGKKANLLKQTVYYRDAGDSKVNPIPTDLRMLSKRTIFKPGPNADLATVHFPNCVALKANGSVKKDSSDHMSHLYDANKDACPSSHPYRIPRTSFLLHFDRDVDSSTLFSMGNGRYGAAGDSFHADYLGAVQNEFNYATDQNRDGDKTDKRDKALIDLCLNDVPESTEVAHPRCGPDPNP